MSRPSVFVAMACYDTMKVETCFSLLNLFNKFTTHNIPAEFRTAKSPYVGHCRNLLTAGFLHSDKDFLLFVDADMQFGADSVFRMLAANYDVCCTPYRLKDTSMKESYPVSFENYDKIDITDKGFVEITSGPTGLMLIHRTVFSKLKLDNSHLQIKFPEEKKKDINAEIMGAENTGQDPAATELWNFFDTSFENHLFKGEDIAFCELARKSGISIHANIDSTTIHHGPYGYKGKFRDALTKVINEEK